MGQPSEQIHARRREMGPKREIWAPLLAPCGELAPAAQHGASERRPWPCPQRGGTPLGRCECRRGPRMGSGRVSGGVFLLTIRSLLQVKCGERHASPPKAAERARSPDAGRESPRRRPAADLSAWKAPQSCRDLVPLREAATGVSLHVQDAADVAAEDDVGTCCLQREGEFSRQSVDNCHWRRQVHGRPERCQAVGLDENVRLAPS